MPTINGATSWAAYRVPPGNQVASLTLDGTSVAWVTHPSGRLEVLGKTATASSVWVVTLADTTQTENGVPEVIYPRTTAQLAGTPTAGDISRSAKGGALFYDYTATVATGTPRVVYRVSTDGTAYVANSGGGGGITALSSATDYNSNLVTPLAAKQAAFIAPRTEGATVTLAAADNAGTSYTPVACVVTVNTGLGQGFGRAFLGAGAVTFAGSATVTDKRVTGSTNPSCSLVCIGLDTYWVVGGKA